MSAISSSENGQGGLAKFFPILSWMRVYSGGWFRLDLVAGLTAAAVVIPQAMAYASIAGLPVEVGLYTALVPMVIYAILGTSRPLSVSATSTIDRIALMVRKHQPKIVVLDCSPVPNFEYTAIKEFIELDGKLHASDVTLWLAALNPEAFETVEKTALGEVLGHERMFLTMEQSVEAYLKRLNEK